MYTLTRKLALQLFRCTLLALVFVAPSQEAFWASEKTDSGQLRSDPAVEAIYLQLYAMLNRLSSVQYTGTIRRTQHVSVPGAADKTFGKPYQLDYDVEYMAQGAMFRSHTRYVGLDGKQHDEELAYDGSKYQRFSELTGVLELTAFPRKIPVQSFVPEAIVVPFVFSLSADETADFRTLLARDRWELLASRTKIIGHQKLQDHECMMVEVAHDRSAEVCYHVWLSVKQDYFPIKCTVSTVQATTEMTVDEICNVHTDDGDLFVPLSITSFDYFPDGTLAQTHHWTVSPKSLIVNAPIPLQKFTITPNRAFSGVFDEDTQKRTIPGESRAAPVARNGNWVLIWANVAIILACLVLYGYKRFGKNKS